MQLTSLWESHSSALSAAAVLLAAWTLYVGSSAGLAWVGLLQPWQQAALSVAALAGAGGGAYALRHDRRRAGALLGAAATGLAGAHVIGPWLLELGPGAQQGVLGAACFGAAALAARALQARRQVGGSRAAGRGEEIPGCVRSLPPQPCCQSSSLYPAASASQPCPARRSLTSEAFPPAATRLCPAVPPHPAVPSHPHPHPPPRSPLPACTSWPC